MAEVLNKMFSKTTKVLVKDGKFNNVQGSYYHYDFSQRVTNNGCYNVIGNKVHNVSNSAPQVIYHGRGVRSMRPNCSATGRIATVDASAIDNHASAEPYNTTAQLHPQVSRPSPYGFPFPQSPGQYLHAQSRDIRAMSGAELAFMENQMAQMSQVMNSEFSVSDQEQNVVGPEMYNDDISEDEMSSQSLSADFRGLTIKEHAPLLPRSTPIHGLSPNTVNVDETSRPITISGNYTEVDDKFHRYNFNSHYVGENNIIENSFGEVIEQTTQILKLRQAFGSRQ